MRALLAGVLILFSFAAFAPAFADDDCRCKGCGCKGGPGWRGPDGFCVSTGKLAEVCGSPAAAPCKQEAATRVCFGKQSALSDPVTKPEPHNRGRAGADALGRLLAGALTASGGGKFSFALSAITVSPMRRLTLALLLAQAFAAPAFALSGATPDGEDRFPFVVEINLDHQLICSGTVRSRELHAHEVRRGGCAPLP